MFTIKQLKTLNDQINSTELNPSHSIKEFQKSLKPILDNTIIGKLTITVDHPETFCEKGMKLEEVELYEKKISTNPNPILFEYHNQYNGLVQFAVYPATNEFFADDEITEVEFLCELLYSAFRRTYDGKMLLRAQDIDSLTGVLNITGFKNLGKRINNKRLMPKFAVIFMNIINFKNVNKEFGHDAGDVIMREYAQKVSNFLEKEGSIAHLGGDNFAILIKKSSLGKLLKFLQEVRVSVTFEGQPISTDISVRAGITEGNRNYPVFEAYLGCAQTAYKSAHEENVDDFVFF